MLGLAVDTTPVGSKDDPLVRQGSVIEGASRLGTRWALGVPEVYCTMIREVRGDRLEVMNVHLHGT